MASTSELKTRGEELKFSDLYQREELKNYEQEDSSVASVEKIFAAAKNVPEPTGKALSLQTKKIAVIEKNQPGVVTYALVGGILGFIFATTAGAGPALVGAIGGPGVLKLVNDSNASEQTAFIKAYMKVNPNASEAELDEALKKYVEIQALNMDRSE